MHQKELGLKKQLDQITTLEGCRKKMICLIKELAWAQVQAQEEVTASVYKELSKVSQKIANLRADEKKARDEIKEVEMGLR